jgi:hypothetical protein
MKKYTAEEAASLPRLRQGRYTLVHLQLTKLQPGEVLFIEKGKDWVSKNPPYKVMRAVAAKTKFKLLGWREEKGLGWFVERLS